MSLTQNYTVLKYFTFLIKKELSNIFFFIPLFLSIGIAAFFNQIINIEDNIIHSMTVFLLLSYMLIRNVVIKNQRLEVVYISLIIINSISVGYSAAAFRTKIVRSPILHTEIRDIVLEGTITAIDMRPKSARIYMTDLQSYQWNESIYGEIPKIIRVNSYINKNTLTLKIGDRIIIESTLLPPPRPVVPNGFDFARYAYFKKIGAIGYITKNIKVITPPINTKKYLYYCEILINKLRQLIAVRIFSCMDNDIAAIAKGILIGDPSAISKSDLDALRIAGTTHLISVSGMHIAVVCAIVFFVIRFFLTIFPTIGLKYNSKRIAAFVAIILTFIYLLLTGAPISGQRSFIMATIVLFGIILDRSAHGIHCITIAAIIILILTPESLFSASLQMSFFASLALIVTFHKKMKNLNERYGKKNVIYKVFIYAYNLAFASLVASFATTPFIMYHFQQFSPYSILANLFCVPLSDLVFMPSGILALILMPIHMEQLPLGIMKIGIELMMFISHYITTLPQATIHIPLMGDCSIILLSVAIFLLCVMKTNIRYIGIPLIIYGFSTSYMSRIPDIIVSGNAKLFVISLEETKNQKKILIPSSRSVERYTREVLAQVYGDKFDSTKSLNKYNISNCNSDYCVWSAHGKRIVIIKSPNEEDFHSIDEKVICDKNTDVLFNMYSNKKCENARINIGIDDIKAKGTHAVYLMRSENNRDNSIWKLEIDNVQDHLVRKF